MYFNPYLLYLNQLAHKLNFLLQYENIFHICSFFFPPNVYIYYLPPIVKILLCGQRYVYCKKKMLQQNKKASIKECNKNRKIWKLLDVQSFKMILTVISLTNCNLSILFLLIGIFYACFFQFIKFY